MKRLVLIISLTGMLWVPGALYGQASIGAPGGWGDRFDWYVDGEHYQTQTEWHTEGAEFPAPFDQKFHLILNVAVGGNWPGNPDGTTVFPQRMDVDYVRVYRDKEREPSP